RGCRRRRVHRTHAGLGGGTVEPADRAFLQPLFDRCFPRRSTKPSPSGEDHHAHAGFPDGLRQFPKGPPAEVDGARHLETEGDHWSIAGAVSLIATRSQHLLSNCACGFPAHSLPMSSPDIAFAEWLPVDTSPSQSGDAGPTHAGVFGATDRSESVCAVRPVATAIEGRGHTHIRLSC